MADTAEQMPLTKKEFARLLQAKLPLNADRSQLHEHIRGQTKLIDYLFRSVAAQGAAILDIRERMVGHKNAIEYLADQVVPGGEPDLIGFEEPKLIIPGVN